MVKTQAEIQKAHAASHAALNHFLTVVLGKDQVNDPEYFNWITYNKIKSMDDLLDASWNVDSMQDTAYNNNGTMELPTMDMVVDVWSLRIFTHSFSYNSDRLMEDEDWMDVTGDEYSHFQTFYCDTYDFQDPPKIAYLTKPMKAKHSPSPVTQHLADTMALAQNVQAKDEQAPVGENDENEIDEEIEEQHQAVFDEEVA